MCNLKVQIIKKAWKTCLELVLLFIVWQYVWLPTTARSYIKDLLEPVISLCFSAINIPSRNNDCTFTSVYQHRAKTLHGIGFPKGRNPDLQAGICLDIGRRIEACKGTSALNKQTENNKRTNLCYLKISHHTFKGDPIISFIHCQQALQTFIP